MTIVMLNGCEAVPSFKTIRNNKMNRTIQFQRNMGCRLQSELIWEGGIHKNSMCPWRVRWNRLCTGDRLSNWNSDLGPTCFLCRVQRENKTTDHVFYKVYGLKKWRIWVYFWEHNQETLFLEIYRSFYPTSQVAMLSVACTPLWPRL